MIREDVQHVCGAMSVAECVEVDADDPDAIRDWFAEMLATRDFAACLAHLAIVTDRLALLSDDVLLAYLTGARSMEGPEATEFVAAAEEERRSRGLGLGDPC